MKDLGVADGRKPRLQDPGPPARRLTALGLASLTVPIMIVIIL